jgi:hypothetical protein
VNSISQAEDSVLKANGVLVGVLQSNDSMESISGFVPEYFITDFNEPVPGLNPSVDGHPFFCFIF